MPSRFNPEPEPTRKIRESGGTILSMGPVADTQFFQRQGLEVVGAAGPGGGGYDTIQEEGAPLTQRTTLNFVGPGLTAADDTTRTTVTLATAAAGGLGNVSAEGTADSLARSDHVHKRDVRVAKDGSDVGTRNRINFTGAGVVVTDDAGNDEVDVAISGGAATGYDQMQEEGVNVAQRTTVDFVSPIITVTDTGAKTEVALPTAAPDNLAVGDAAAEGAASSGVRSDHQHGVPTGTPVALGNVAAEGASTSFPRLDHVHKRDVRVAEATVDVGTRNRLNFAIGGEFDITDDVGNDEVDIQLTAPAAPADVTKAVAAAGTADARARADHKHDVSTAAAGGLANANAEGSATSLARSDHAHKRDVRVAEATVDVGTRNRLNFAIGGEFDITDDVGNDEVDIQLTAPAAPADVTKAAAAAGSADARARADHKHDVTTAAAGAAGVADVAAEGSATSLARSDHVHGFATGVPSGLANADTEGVSASFVRLDHQHKRDVRVAEAGVDVGTRNRLNFVIAGEFDILDDLPGDEIDIQLASPAAPANVTKAAAAAGTADARARADHKHDVTTAVAGAAGVGDSAAEGSATSLARSDHDHSFATGTPAALGNAAAEGASTSFPRLDHVHKRDIRVAYNSSDVGTRNRLNFLGGGVFVVDDSGGDEVEVTIPSMLVVATAAGATLAASGNPTRAVVTGTNHVYPVLDYPDGSATEAFWNLRLPQDIGTNKTLTVTILWIAAVATTGAVTWGAAVLGRTDSDPWDAALGSETTVSTTTDGTAGDLNTTVITLAASGVDAFDALILRIRRLGSDGGDSMTADARFLMATVEW